MFSVKTGYREAVREVNDSVPVSDCMNDGMCHENSRQEGFFPRDGRKGKGHFLQSHPKINSEFVQPLEKANEEVMMRKTI